MATGVQVPPDGAAGLTVPPGDPQSLHQLASRLRTAAQAADTLGSKTTTLTTTIPADAQWFGKGTESFGGFAGNLGKGAGSCVGPLQRIANAVDNYASVLDTAQQKAQEVTALSQAAAATGDSSLAAQAQTAAQNASDAAISLESAGSQAAAQVTSAADDLQVESLFGTQGPVTIWVSGQPILRQHFLWNSSNPIPRIGAGGPPEIFPPLQGPGGRGGTGTGILPPGALGPLAVFNTAKTKSGGQASPSPTPSPSQGGATPQPGASPSPGTSPSPGASPSPGTSPSPGASPSPTPSPWPTAGHGNKLPQKGQFPYVPPKGGHGQPVPVKGGGFKDAGGNTWIWARPNVQHGGPHWDVQLKGGGYVNVSPDGKIL